MAEITRVDGRSYDQLRPLHVVSNVFAYAAGSVLYELGDTKVLCAVTLEPGVPHFLRGTKTGWMTAHYSMLPTSTQVRIERESKQVQRNGRFVEISRLIGRTLRVALDLKALGEQTIIIDCDVLQADGGTRTACITGAMLALKQAQESWLTSRIISKPFIIHDIAAISIGLIDGHPVLDPNYQEDSEGSGDFNFIMTRTGMVIEVQGTAEKHPVSWHTFDQLRFLADNGIKQIFASLESEGILKRPKSGAFTLAQRLQHISLNS